MECEPSQSGFLNFRSSQKASNALSRVNAAFPSGFLDRPFDGRVGAPKNSIARLNGLSREGFSHDAKAVEGKHAEAR